MTTRFTNLDALVPFAKLRAKRGTYDGLVTPQSQQYINVICRHEYAYSPEESALLIFSRDTGHHTSGWWKNPDYERCWHLSISYQSPRLGLRLDQDRSRSEKIAEAFYGDDLAWCWIEGPYSPEGKVAQVWHYRVFCDEGWNAIKPRGEVYGTEFTELGWRSFSEIHGWSPKREQAPFLLEGER